MSAITNLEEEMLNASIKVASIIDPEDWDAPNCSHHKNIFDQPPARVFLRNLGTSQTILLSVATGLEIFILALAILQWRQIYSKINNEERRNKLYFLISLFPTASLCCYIGMVAPRTSIVLNSLGVLYTLFSMAVLISLIKHLFGGRKAFITTLSYDDKAINMQSPPFCCCCKCLPEPASTEQNIRRFEWLVIQAPIVRALVVTFNIIAVAEFREHARLYLHVSEIASVLSLLLAIFGMHTMARLTTTKLQSYGFMTIFRLVDVTLLFYTAQQPVIFDNILVRFQVIDCGPYLSAHDNGRFICNFVILCQLTLLALVATLTITPKRSALFDGLDSQQAKLQVQLDETSHLRNDEYGA